MNSKKWAGGVAAAISAALLLSGCSFHSTMQGLVGSITSTSKETVVNSTSSGEGVPVSGRAFDDAIPAPTFTTDLGIDVGGSIETAQNGKVDLAVEATAADGGPVSYQWYSSRTQVNGGGTIIPGATGPTYTPDTTEGGTMYYYVVAANTKDGKVNEAVSSIVSVKVWTNMYWQNTADKGYQYLNRDDGTFPKNISMEIDGVTYTFDDEGFAVDPDTGAYIDITTGGEPAEAAGSSATSTPAAQEAVTAQS